MSAVNKNKRPRQAFDSRRGRPRRRTGPAPPPPPKTCSECSAEQPKYKCPKCWEPYCSIVCCRKHKEKDCKAEAAATKDQAAAAGAQKSKYLPSDQLSKDPIQNSKLQREQFVEDYDEDLDEGWKITKDMMDEMDKSDWLRKELQDGGLRQLIHEVYGSSRNVIRSGGNASATTYQEEALANLQSQYPNFRIFLEKLKVMTGILERQQVHEGQEEDLSSWLEYTRTSDDVGPLALKPLPSRQEFPLPPEPDQAASSSEKETSSSSENESSSDGSNSLSESEDE
jgi:hypothetical protein